MRPTEIRITNGRTGAVVRVIPGPPLTLTLWQRLRWFLVCRHVDIRNAVAWLRGVR